MTDVLVICEYASLNGGERSLLSVIDRIRDEGFNVSVAAPPTGDLATELRENRIPVQGFFTEDDSGARLEQDELRRRLSSLIERVSPDLIHANSLSVSRLVGPVARELGIPSCGHLRDILRLTSKAISDLNCNSRLFAVSQATKDWHMQQGLEGAKTFVLYNGVDLNEFQPRLPTGYLHKEFGLIGGERLIGVIGQVGLRKGFDLFLKAARYVAGEFSDAYFLIIGQRFSNKQESIDFESELQQTSREGLLSGRVRFCGWRSDVSQLLNELTLLVHPARQEPLGRVLLEAAASGVAIIATDVGGTREILPTNGSTAILVPSNNVEVLRDMMIEVLGNAQLRTRMSLAARKRIEEQFNAQLAGANLARHYRELCNLE